MNCDIIKDLLPLYCDGVCSEETSRAVEEHLTTCPACRTLLDEMRREPVMPEPIQTQAKQEAKVLQGVKRKFSLRRRLSVLAVALVAMVALVVLTASSDIENPIPYQEGMVTAKLAVDEAIDIHFYGDHYASFWAFYRETADRNDIYFCYTQTLKSSTLPLTADHGHICIGNTLMTDFTTASYQVPYSQDINAVYYLEASQEDYLNLPAMSDDEFTQAAQDAVLLWEREAG
jgi:hypothetical protein